MRDNPVHQKALKFQSRGCILHCPTFKSTHQFIIQGKPRVQHRFGERIDLLLQKSVRAAARQVKERQREARENGMPQQPPSFEEFSALVDDLMESGKRADLDRLRNLSLKELFEQTWSQKLRNYAIQKQIRDAYDALVRRSRRDS